MKYDIFISYRREGGDTLAQLLYDRLTNRGYRVFLDIESLNAGKFNEKLLDVIEECKDMIIVLPPNALDRCHNEGDWVYRELKHGIEHSKNIIPVLMKDFLWPDNLPEDIADIRNYNGIIDNKDYFDAVIDKITTLLKSKPVFGGKLFQRNQPKKSSFKEKVKKRRKFILAAVVAVIACAGVFGVLKYKEEQERIREESFVTIELTPKEEMSASEYYDAIEIVEKRFEILADDQECIVEENKETVSISLPLEVFHDIDIENVLQCYITRPIEIYLAGTDIDTKEYFHIERSAIENVEIVTEVPVDVDFTNYELQGIENEEDCRYFAITVNEDTVKEAKAWMKEQNQEEYRLFQDMETFEFSSWYYYLAGAFEGDNKLYFVDNYQYDNILELIQYNYSNETFPGYLLYSVKKPIHWETVDEEVNFGENQCEAKELSGELVRYDYSSYGAEDMSEGEYLDIVKIFKGRLDALGTPYAFGYHVDDPYTFSIKIDPKYMNNVVYSSIGKCDGLVVKSNLYNIQDEFSVGDVEVSEESDGTYSLEMITNTYWREYSRENFEKSVDSQEEIMLCIEGYPASPIDTATVMESYDGHKFVFNGYSNAEIDTINKENKFMYDYLATVHMDDKLPMEYTIEAYFMDDDKELDEVDYIVPDNVISPKVKEAYEQILDGISSLKEYTADVSYIGQKVELDLELNEKDFSPETVNSILKTLYEKASMEEGNSADIAIKMHYGGNQFDNYISFDIDTECISEHKVRLSAYYSYGLAKDFIDGYEKLLNEDEFYKNVYIAEYDIKDGKISFR